MRSRTSAYYTAFCQDCGERISTRRAKRCRSCAVSASQTKPVIERVMERVELDANSCWLWQGYTQNGYAVTAVGPQGAAKNIRVHRFTYEFFREPVPEGLTLDHLCRVRNCVNPWHLEAVTEAENILRGESPPAKNARKTHCPRGHEYVRAYGQRWCFVCDRERHRERRESALVLGAPSEEREK